MQKPDLSRHVRIKTMVGKECEAHLPWHLTLLEPERLQVWVMEDAAQYRWRGLVNKITANLLTQDIDYTIKGCSIFLKGMDSGVEQELILVVR